MIQMNEFLASAGSSTVRRIAPSAVLFAGILTASVMLYAVRQVPSAIAFAGLAILWVSSVPAVIAPMKMDSEGIPFFAAIGLFYAIFFGLPVFAIPLAWNDAESILVFSRVPLGTIKIEVLLLVLTAITAMGIAFFASRAIVFFHVPRFRLPAFVTLCDVRPLLWVLVVGHMVFEFVPAVALLPSVGQFLDPAIYVALAGFFLLWNTGKLSRLEAVLVVALVLPFELLARIRGLFLTDIVFLAVFAMFVLWRMRRMKWIFAIGAIVLVLISLYGARNLARNPDESLSERLTKMARFYTIFLSKGELQIGETRPPYRIFESITERTGHLWLFHVVDNKTPDPVPYWNGETYKPLLTSFIPRAIYPGKPEERTGGEFGRRYGFMLPDQYESSLNLPWIVELLTNFGRGGVIVGMIFFGILLAFIDRVFNAPDGHEIETAIGLTLMLPFVYPESNFSVSVGLTVPLFIAFTTYFTLGAWLLTRLRRLRLSLSFSNTRD